MGWAIWTGHVGVLPGRIVGRLDGRVIVIDTGMVNGDFYPGGVSSALEWNGNMVTAIYLDRPEPLVAPALQSAAPAASRWRCDGASLDGITPRLARPHEHLAAGSSRT